MRTYEFNVSVTFVMTDSFEIKARNDESAYEMAVEHMNFSGYDPSEGDIQEINRDIVSSCCLDD